MFDTQSPIINVSLFTLITDLPLLNILWEKYNMERGSYLGWVSFSIFFSPHQQWIKSRAFWTPLVKQEKRVFV